jgi:hypothetical protein
LNLYYDAPDKLEYLLSKYWCKTVFRRSAKFSETKSGREKTS